MATDVVSLAKPTTNGSEAGGWGKNIFYRNFTAEQPLHKQCVPTNDSITAMDVVSFAKATIYGWGGDGVG